MEKEDVKYPIPTICLKPTKVCTLTQVLKNEIVSSKIEAVDAEIFEESCCCISEHFKLLSLEIASLTSYSNCRRLSFIHQTESGGSVEKGKWLHIFVTPHLQSLSPVLISSQSCLYRCSRHFTETPSSSEEFLFHRNCVFMPPPLPCFLYTQRIVLLYEGIVKHAGFLLFGGLQLCKNDAGVCVGSVSGTAFPFV